jgi:hypothetical protein
MQKAPSHRTHYWSSKTDFRLARNYLKGAIGDHINLLMAATAWNLNKWLMAIFLRFFSGKKYQQPKEWRKFSEKNAYATTNVHFSSMIL